MRGLDHRYFLDQHLQIPLFHFLRNIQLRRVYQNFLNGKCFQTYHLCSPCYRRYWVRSRACVAQNSCQMTKGLNHCHRTPGACDRSHQTGTGPFDDPWSAGFGVLINPVREPKIGKCYLILLIDEPTLEIFVCDSNYLSEQLDFLLSLFQRVYFPLKFVYVHI